MCSVPFGLVALGLVAPGLGRVAALNYGSGSHGRLGSVSRLWGVARLGGIARLGRRGRVGPHDLALGRIAALHDLRLAVVGLDCGALGRVAGLRLDVALLDHGLDHGGRVDDGRYGAFRDSIRCAKKKCAL